MTSSDAFSWASGSSVVDLSTEYFAVPGQVARAVANLQNPSSGFDIVGYYTLNNGAQAFAITNNVLEDLSSGYQDSWAYALNDQDQIVGAWASQPNGTHHALYWLNGQNYDLNTLLPSGSGWVLNDAVSIDQDGLIVGNGSYQGTPSAFAAYAPAPPYQGDDYFTHRPWQ